MNSADLTTWPKKNLEAMVDRLEFLLGLTSDRTSYWGNTAEMEQGLKNYKAELQRREKLHA